MFALRGIAVSLTFFVLVYCLLSALVAVAWRSLKWLHAAERSLAALLFALRVLPLAASVVVTFAFVVPSFQLLEPRSIDIDEGIGAVPLALGICALLLIACGCFRVIAAQTKTSRVVARWLEGANPLVVDAAAQTEAQTVTFRSRRGIPPLTLVGVRRPRVLVSESAVALLSDNELRIALQHELAHMQSRDNLKKLVFRFCPCPGMAKLESAWSQAAELAADDAAVSNLDDAVDLAAALVKLSRLLPVAAAPVCTVGFVTGSISVRVARLLAWDEAHTAQTMRIRPWYAIPPVLVTLLCVFVTYGPALTLTHEVTEWLVR
ncbi:MAG TPA: M56 family metallopeptidase [Terriglobales bacterium]|jgi:beta-lactamase regulating signal transducer with metallopeptidase domain|nr:M56 family metallopeptidase [Terriglobales bacterium]